MTSSVDQACSAIASLYDQLCQALPEFDRLDQYLLRRLFDQRILDTGWDARKTGEPKIINGEAFARIAVPFSDLSYAGAGTLSYVDPHRVLAGTYYRPPQLSDADAAELANFLDDAATKGGDSSAQYIKLGPFGIYVAIEGKNRVTVYRNLRRKIHAKVCQTGYPQPQDFRLRAVRPWRNIVALEYCGPDKNIRSRTGRRYENWHSNPNVKLLAYPESVSLFTEYGVPWGQPLLSMLAPLEVRRLRLIALHSFYCR